MSYIAPFRLSDEIVPIPPEGTFLLPVCTTAERLAKILSALYYGGLNISEDGEMTHLVDVLHAMSKIRPECDIDATGCTTFRPAQDRVVYRPGLDDTDLPLGYLVNPWVRITGDNPLVGLRTGDIITDIVRMPPLPSIWDHLDEPAFILALGYPSISIESLVGSGTVRVYLLNVVLGGKAIVIKDNNVFSWAFLDTNLDSASLPPETYTEHLIEYEFEGAGEHRLDIVFVPNVSADIEFLGFGGGIRKVEICGFEENEMTDNCCPEDTEILKEILRTMKAGFTILPLADVAPGDATVPCAPIGFDFGTEDDDVPEQIKRYNALCLTIERYVSKLIFQMVLRLGMPSSYRSMALAIPGVPYDNSFMFNAVWQYYNPVTIPVVKSWFENSDYADIICIMLTYLQGKETTLSAFRGSLEDVDTTGYSDEKKMLIAYADINNHRQSVFDAFVNELEASYDVVSADSEYACSCVGTGACDVNIFELVLDTPGTIIKLDDDTWEITAPQTDITEADVQRFIVEVRDASWRCFNHAFTSTAMSSYRQYNCAGILAEGTGGGGGEVVWERMIIAFPSGSHITSPIVFTINIACP